MTKRNGSIMVLLLLCTPKQRRPLQQLNSDTSTEARVIQLFKRPEGRQSDSLQTFPVL